MSSKVKTLSQIAAEYGIHISTLRRWIKPIRKDLQIKNRKLLLPWQTKILYDFLNTKK
jgi:transposase-like protein